MASQGHFVEVLANQSDIFTGRAEDPGAEYAELAIAQDGDFVTSKHGPLLEDLKCGGEGLDKDGGMIADRFRYWMQIGFWHSHAIGHGPIVPEDAEHGAVWAMCFKTSGTPVAMSARVIDLGCIAVAIFIDSDKFMAENTLKTHVSGGKLNVGVADSAMRDVQDDFIWQWSGLVKGWIKPDLLAIAVECSHERRQNLFSGVFFGGRENG